MNSNIYLTRTTRASTPGEEARLAGELAKVRAKLDATPYDAPGRKVLEAQSRELFGGLQQIAPDHPALKPSTTVKRTPAAVVASLDAAEARDHVFATCTDPAAELATVRDEIAVCDHQIAAAQVVEKNATGSAALRSAAARCLDLYSRRRRLEHRSLALSALVRVEV